MAIMKDNRLDNISLDVTTKSPIINHTPVAVTKESEPKEPKKSKESQFITTIAIPDDLRIELKIFCLQNRKKQKDVMVEAIRFYLASMKQS